MMEHTLKVEALENGTVIDHIPAGQGRRILKLFRMSESGERIYIGFNLPSRRTGKKDLIKVGAVLGIAGGIGSAVSGSAASSGLGEVVDATGGVETAVSSTANTGIPAAMDATGGLETAIENSANTSLASRAAQTAGINPNIDPSINQGGTLANRAAQSAAAPPDMPVPSTPQVPPSVADGARGLTQNDLTAFWEKLKGAGKWMGQNPELLKVGGSVLESMYGPQAEQLDYQKSLMERARANLNNPIKLGRATS